MAERGESFPDICMLFPNKHDRHKLVQLVAVNGRCGHSFLWGTASLFLSFPHKFYVYFKTPCYWCELMWVLKCLTWTTMLESCVQKRKVKIVLKILSQWKQLTVIWPVPHTGEDPQHCQTHFFLTKQARDVSVWE